MPEALNRAWDFFLAEWTSFAWPTAILVFVILAGLAIRRIVFGNLRRWSARTETLADDLVVESFYTPTLFWVVILAIYLATELSRLPASVTTWSSKVLLGLLIVSVTIALAKLAGSLVRVYGQRADGGMPMGTLTELLASLIIGLIGFLTLLNAYGVSITPLLTALGVGGLAVALALQDTLSNFFAGFYMSLARQIRVGDFISLESGQRGYVTDIGWRATTLRELPFNSIIIPNNKLAQSIVINFNLPETQMSLTVPVGVSYDSDTRNVERILLEVLRQAQADLPGIREDFEPRVRFSGFGDSSLDFAMVVRVRDFDAQFEVQSEIRHRVFERFREEGISIPFPIRTLEFKNPLEFKSPPPPAR